MEREKAQGLASDAIQTAIDTMHNNDIMVHSITHKSWENWLLPYNGHTQKAIHILYNALPRNKNSLL